MADEAKDYIKLLDIGDAAGDITPLITNLGSWSTNTDAAIGPTSTSSIAIKQRWQYGLHETFELAVARPDRWTHAVVTPANDEQGNTTMYYVYRIDSSERSDTKYVSPSASGRPVTVSRFTCTLDPVATMYHMCMQVSGTFTLTGHWSRYPSPVSAVREPLQIRPAQMKRSRSVKLASNIPNPAYEDHNTPYNIPYYNVASLGTGTLTKADIIWVEVNAISNGAFITWGTFCAMNPNYEISTSKGVNYGGSTYPVAWVALSDIINDPETYINVPASSIISIGVSARCPDAVSWYAYNGIDNIELLGGNLRVMADARRSGYKICMYNMGTHTTPVKTNGEITLTDAEIMMGQVRVVDVFGNPVASIDTRYADPTTNKITYKIAAVSNGLGISSVIILADGTEITFPEGTVPFNGSAYKEYAVAQLKYDREMLAMAQERVIVDTATGLTGSVVNGAIAGLASGGLGAATGVMGAATTGINAYMSYTQNERTQSAKERLMRDTPDTVYNNAYGTEYIRKMLLHSRDERRGIIAVNMPDGITSGEISAYAWQNGYPVTDYYTSITSSDMTTLAEGFMRADILNGAVNTQQIMIGNMACGEFRRNLEQQLKQGVHFKVIT